MEGMQLSARAEGETGKKGISGSTIKIIAVIAMLIDHTAAVVMLRQILANGLRNAAMGGQAQIINWLQENAVLYYGYQIMRMIGRLGFPIFCFLLVEGFQRTRNVKKYALRLGLFALISEIPFNLAITGNLWHTGYQNVYFTLLLGLLALCAYSFFAGYEQAGTEKDLPAALRMVLTVTGVLLPAAYPAVFLTFKSMGSRLICSGIFCLVTVLVLFLYGRKKGFRSVQTACADITALVPLMFLAEFMYTDYAGMGVLTISAMYLFRKNKVKSMLAGCIILTVMSISEVPAFLALIFIALYNGKRGLKMKYFFYAFYPAHLLLLYLLAMLLGLGNIPVV